MIFLRELKILAFLTVSHGTVQAQDQYFSSASEQVRKVSSSGSHRVQSGDTLYSIARRHGISASALIRHNGISDPSTLRIGQNLTIPGKPQAVSPQRKATTTAGGGAGSAGGSHTLRRGETLSKVARMHRVTVKQLQQWNGITDPTKLQVGQEIRIGSGGGGAKSGGAETPAKVASAPQVPAQSLGERSHTLQRGETLSSISRKYGTSIASLMEINGITDPTRLAIGQKLALAPKPAALPPPTVVQNIPAVVAEVVETKPPTPVEAYKSLVSGGASHTFRQHTVRPGDTLHSISQENNVSVEALRSANGLGESNFIRDGQQLRIPDGNEIGNIAASPRPPEPIPEQPQAASETKPLFEIPPVEATPRPVQPPKQYSNHFGFAPTPTAPGRSEYLDYTVGPSVSHARVAGERLQAEDIELIAETFSTTADEIRRLNNLPSGEPLTIGAVLTVPAEGMFGH